MDKNEALILIVEKIFHAMGPNERAAVIIAIREELRNLNSDYKTEGTNGATEVAKIAKKITGDDFLIGNGFN